MAAHVKRPAVGRPGASGNADQLDAICSPNSTAHRAEQHRDGALPIDGSNSLADLAARINAAHESVAGALKSGIEHAIVAGEALIEAKAKVPHGEWLAWLKANCTVSERSAQAYMRVARGIGGLEDHAKAQRVADLSFRD